VRDAGEVGLAGGGAGGGARGSDASAVRRFGEGGQWQGTVFGGAGAHSQKSNLFGDVVHSSILKKYSFSDLSTLYNYFTSSILKKYSL
jgi:hypothetical protein